MAEVRGVVFDLPEHSWTAEIRRLRAAYDHPRLLFPVEITVAGSSGLGWLTPSQVADSVAKQLSDVARSFAPFEFNFAKVESFPETQVYYLAPEQTVPFVAFQRALAASSLKFEPTPFSYTPHCTIVQLHRDAPPSAHAEVATFPVPGERITISSVSLYAVNLSQNDCRLVSRFALGA
jgi:2'-5' RNA ligase